MHGFFSEANSLNQEWTSFSFGASKMHFLSVMNFSSHERTLDCFLFRRFHETSSFKMDLRSRMDFFLWCFHDASDSEPFAERCDFELTSSMNPFETIHPKHNKNLCLAPSELVLSRSDPTFDVSELSFDRLLSSFSSRFT